MPEKKGGGSQGVDTSSVTQEIEHTPETLFAELYRFKRYLEFIGAHLEPKKHPATHDATGKVVSPRAVERLVAQMDSVRAVCRETKEKIDQILPSLLATPEHKAFWEAVAGKNITTIAEAEAAVEKLVQEIVQTYQQYEKLYHGDSHTAAALVLGLGEQPAFDNGQDREDWENQIFKRERLLHALALVPGNHLSGIKVYQACHPIMQGEVTAEAAVACLKTLAGDFKIAHPKADRPIELDDNEDHTYTKAELDRIEIALKNVAPILAKAEKATPKQPARDTAAQPAPVAQRAQPAPARPTPAPARTTTPAITRENATTLAETQAVDEAQAMEARINNRPPAQERSPIVISPERSLDYKQMAEVFKENFFGIEAVERAFTLQNGVKLYEFSVEQKRQAETTLRDFIRQPDVAQFLVRIANGTIPRDEWQLRYQPNMAVGLTMKRLNELLAPDMVAQNQGKLLYDSGGWKNGEPFFTRDELPSGWVLSVNEVVENTTNKTDNQQTVILRDFAARVGLDFHSANSRSLPVETLWRFIMDLRVNGKRILTNPARYDRSSVQTSGGFLVSVGRGDAGGLRVDGIRPDDAGGSLGASFSRRGG